MRAMPGGTVALVVTLVLLAGCGYQLKGQFRLAEGLSPMVWESRTDADELYLAMRDTFALYGLALGTRPADNLLRIHSQQEEAVSLSDATVLALTVEWSLVNQYGAEVISHRSTRAETRLSLSPTVDEDEARLERRDFLRDRIALRVLDQLEGLTEDELNRQPESRTR